MPVSNCIETINFSQHNTTLCFSCKHIHLHSYHSSCLRIIKMNKTWLQLRLRLLYLPPPLCIIHRLFINFVNKVAPRHMRFFLETSGHNISPTLRSFRPVNFDALQQQQKSRTNSTHFSVLQTQFEQTFIIIFIQSIESIIINILSLLLTTSISSC